jgi:hypothetical protein
MRSRFALALAGSAILALCASAILASAVGAFERHELQPGDSALGTLLVPGTFNEFTMVAARGSSLTVSMTKSGAGSLVPALGIYNDDYASVPAIPTGTSAAIAPQVPSGQYRILVGGQRGTVGGYKLRAALVPALKFAGTATAAAPVSTFTFGSYPGFDATVTIRWKGPAPVTLVSITGPDGAALTSAAAPKTTASAFQQGGYRATAIGDHVVTVDAPNGTVKWSVTVQLSGRLPHGTSHDFRATSPPEVATVEFPTFGRSPIVRIAGERGGPNDIVLSATGSVPDAAFLDGGAGSGGCSRVPRDAGTPPTTYILYCTDGFFADVVDVVRDDAGLVTSFDAPSMRTPAGSGTSRLSNITHDAAGRTTGWTEIRRFDASGRSYELVFSGAQYFTSNGGCKAFRVVERLLPDGLPRTYDYAPLR